MEYRFLGRTGLRLSALSMGTMSFGGDADEGTSRQMFDRCREAGINTFDCADAYSAGRAETILGRLIAGCRNEVVITTKAYFPTGTGANARGSSRYHLVQAVENSLRRLGTDRIDLFFLHRFDDATDLEETLRALEDLVRAGKVLYPAVSNFAAWQTMKALGISRRAGFAPIVCTQPMYNLVKRQAEVEILPMAQAEGVGVMPYSPLGGGLLTGKYGVDERPGRGRLVDNEMYGVRYGADENYKVAARFTAFAKARGYAPAALAIAWANSHPAVTSTLVGARNMAQLEGCLAAAEVQVDAALRQELSALSTTPAVATDRNEEVSAHNYGAR